MPSVSVFVRLGVCARVLFCRTLVFFMAVPVLPGSDVMVHEGQMVLAPSPLPPVLAGRMMRLKAHWNTGSLHIHGN